MPRTADDFFRQIMTYAQKDPAIRLVTLEGSRANPMIKPDRYQDFDLSFFVLDEHYKDYVKDASFLDFLGPRRILQEPENMELFPPEQLGYSYLMIMEDHHKLDLTIYPLSYLKQYLSHEPLKRVLLDKDKRIKEKIIPTDQPFHLQKPSAQAFQDSANEFYFVSSYVAKGLCRGEILFANAHFERILRRELLRNLAWYVGTEDGFNLSLGKDYKFLEQYLPEDVWEQLLETFNLSSEEKTWHALKVACLLFSRTQNKIAEALDYEVPPYAGTMQGHLEYLYGLWLDKTF